MEINEYEHQVITDEALCNLARNGDGKAMDTLIRRYNKNVLACARRFFLSGGDNDDLIQEGMLGLLSAIHNYEPGRSSFPTFASVCIRRSIISAVRSSQNKNNDILNKSLSIEDLENISLLSPSDPESLIIDEDERIRKENELLARLSEFETLVLHLYLKGLSYQEMAAQLSRPVKSVDNAVQRIRQKLT